MSGENIVHFGGIRLRVVGSGNLQPTLYSLDELKSKVMVSIALLTSNSEEPVRLVNFSTQRALLELKVTELSEYFSINRIVVFGKPIYSQYPQ